MSRKPDAATHVRNTSGLAAHAERKALETHARVLKAIETLTTSGQAVNFNTVMKASGVTKSYLYSRVDLRQRIESLRQQQAPIKLKLVSGTVREQSRTDKSKDVIISAQAKRIKEVEAEITRLKAENKKLYGEIYEKL